MGDIDPRLLEEAFRRACAARLNAETDPQAMLAVFWPRPDAAPATCTDLLAPPPARKSPPDTFQASGGA